MIPADPHWAAVTLAAWLLTYLCHSALLLGSVALLGRWRKLPASFEQTLWKTAIIGSLITATVVILGWDSGTLGARVHLAPSLPAPTLQPGSLVHGAAPASDAELPAHRTWMILSAWALLGALGLVRLLGARRKLREDLGRRRLLVSGPEREMLRTLASSAGMRRPIRLTVSERLGSPIAIGHDEICLPERALIELRPQEIQSALAHELAHLVHRDPSWRSFTAGVSAVFFFQPLLRLARRRIDETSEYLADDWAVRHSGNEMSLARCLATVAGWQAPRPLAVGASGMAGGTSPLLRRVERLLGARPAEPARAWCLGIAMLLVIGGWILAPAATTLPRNRPSETLLSSTVTGFITPLAPAPHVDHPVPLMPSPRAIGMPRHEKHPDVAVRQHRRHRYPVIPRQLDRETAPRPQVIMIPHDVLRARLDVLRALVEAEQLDPQVARALLEAQRRLIEMEMAERGVRVLWMIDPPAPEIAPTVPPAPPSEIKI